MRITVLLENLPLEETHLVLTVHCRCAFRQLAIWAKASRVKHLATDYYLSQLNGIVFSPGPAGRRGATAEQPAAGPGLNVAKIETAFPASKLPAAAFACREHFQARRPPAGE